MQRTVAEERKTKLPGHEVDNLAHKVMGMVGDEF